MKKLKRFGNRLKEVIKALANQTINTLTNHDESDPVSIFLLSVFSICYST